MQGINEGILSVVSVVITYLLTMLGSYITKLIKTKIKNENLSKSLENAANAVLTSVNYVSQTYVDNLKKENIFDKEAQKEAFKKAYDRAKEMLSEETQRQIQDTFGNFNLYLESKIESAIQENKKAKP